MNIKLKRHRVCTIEGDKRQYAPYTIQWECPHCGRCGTREYGYSNYFSYPTFGEWFIASVYCHHCDHEMHFKVKLIINMKIKPVEE